MRKLSAPQEVRATQMVPVLGMQGALASLLLLLLPAPASQAWLAVCAQFPQRNERPMRHGVVGAPPRDDWVGRNHPLVSPGNHLLHKRKGPVVSGGHGEGNQVGYLVLTQKPRGR